jgi:hypothetical protein
MSLFFSFIVAVSASQLGCNSQTLKLDNSNDLLKNEEYEKQIKVATIPAAAPSGEFVRVPGPPPVPGAFAVSKSGKVTVKKAPKGKRGKAPKADGAGESAVPSEATAASTPAVTVSGHPPPLEDQEGFVARRPVKDPFRVGEKTVLEASYFGVVAGELALEVRPFVEVNGRKSYNFAGTAISTSVFAMFYAVDDWFETFVDFETLTPYTYALHVKEKAQLREARSIFNWEKGRASFWDKKINAEKKVEEKKHEWDIPAYSQNIFSIAYYIRTFQLKPGKKLAIRLAHENENLIVTSEVLRREKLSTAVGDLDTVVVKPKIEINGVFKPVGDIFIWFTDDDRKLLVRMESKIKIGTIVASVKSIDRGQD